MISFFTAGIPQPKGSTKGFGFIRKHGPMAGKIGVAITNDNTKAKPWAAAVSHEAAIAAGGIVLSGPVAVKVTFYLPRPKGHFGKRGLKPSAPAFPTVKPDLDKLTRCAMDALKGVLLSDDSIIVRRSEEKLYALGTPPGMAIEVDDLGWREDAVKATEPR